MFSQIGDIERFLHNRQAALGMNFGLERMSLLLEKLGNPHHGQKYIHIAGSNGKGSTLQFLKAILIQAGYKTASFTSPYLERLNEQLKINEEMITDWELVEVFRKIWPAVEEMDQEGKGPTQFEILTAAAFQYFHEQNPDVVLLETGLGGRLDTTNVVQPLLSVITTISLEHTNILGDTLAEIAFEKAGIIKKEIPVISGVTEEEPAQVIREKAKTESASCIEMGRDFMVKNIKQSGGSQTFTYQYGKTSAENLRINMLGAHQIHNAALAVTAACVIREQYGFAISEEAIKKGVEMARWKGRFEEVSEHPAVLLDGAHNPAGTEVLIKTLKDVYPGKKYVFVFSAFRDKDYQTMLRQLEKEAKSIILTEFEHERAASLEELNQIQSDKVQAWKDWHQAIREGLKAAEEENALLVITGSLHFLMLVRPLFAAQK